MGPGLETGQAAADRRDRRLLLMVMMDLDEVLGRGWPRGRLNQSLGWWLAAGRGGGAQRGRVAQKQAQPHVEVGVARPAAARPGRLQGAVVRGLGEARSIVVCKRRSREGLERWVGFFWGGGGGG